MLSVPVSKEAKVFDDRWCLCIGLDCLNGPIGHFCKEIAHMLHMLEPYLQFLTLIKVV